MRVPLLSAGRRVDVVIEQMDVAILIDCDNLRPLNQTQHALVIQAQRDPSTVSERHSD